MKTKKNYKIKRILNNSSIIVDGLITEQILMGKGIGFGFKPGDTLPFGTEYEKSYQLLANTSNFHRIINGYDEKTVEMVMDTIREIARHNQGEFTTQHLVTIADHLAAMFERIKVGEAIYSFFSVETKTIYPDSFKRALEIADIIDKEHKVELPEAEIAYIALYLENLNNGKNKKEVEQMSAILTEINELFERDVEHNIDKESLAYSRFLTHIHILVKAEKFKKANLSPAINNAILQTYAKYRTISEEIIKIIESEINRDLGDHELVYIVIHLVNLFEERES